MPRDLCPSSIARASKRPSVGSVTGGLLKTLWQTSMYSAAPRWLWLMTREEARAVAAELGLPNWWPNDQASSYAAPSGDPSASRVFDHPGLRVFAASREHLLAMKALGARPRDAQDIKHLTEVLNLHTVAEVLALVQDVFPEGEPPPRLRLLLEDIFGRSI